MKTVSKPAPARRRALLLATAVAPLALAVAVGPAAADAAPRATRTAVLSAAQAAPAAAAAAEPSIAGMTSWSGKVTKTVDGDTDSIDIASDGLSGIPVRNAGIQAMERGECHAIEAEEKLRALTPVGTPVRLSARYASSTSQGRPLRHVDIVRPGYPVVDVQSTLLSGGYVLWDNISAEASRATAYLVAAQQAARSGKQMYDPDFCGSGPQQSVPLKMWINFDAEGDDQSNVNGEYVRVLNQGTEALSVGGWWLRASDHRTPLRFPAGTVIPAGKYVTLRVGSGTSSGSTYYWGKPEAFFPNETTSGYFGQGMYLFDPQGDVRSSVLYPCVYACTDPGTGKLAITVVPNDPRYSSADQNKDEYAYLRNTGTGDINLSYHVVTAAGHVLELPAGVLLHAGETLTLRMGKGTGSRLEQFWGMSRPLPDAGGALVVRTTENTRLACRDWGSGSC